MGKQKADGVPGVLARSDQPLIGLIVRHNGQEMVGYFAEEEALDAAATDSNVEEALSLAGAWRDLDWSEAEAELDRIRHESRPTPPNTDL